MSQSTASSIGLLGSEGNRPVVPNADVIDHTGSRHKFYCDLIQGRIVFIHYFSLESERKSGILENIGRVATLLGARLGQDVQICSITSDSIKDTADALAARATQLHVPHGWYLLSGAKPELEFLRSALYRRGQEEDDPADFERRRALGRFWGSLGVNALCGGSEEQDCSTSLIRYGNDALGLWGSVPSSVEPSQIVARAHWVTIPAPRRSDAPLRRGGPRQITFSS